VRSQAARLTPLLALAVLGSCSRKEDHGEPEDEKKAPVSVQAAPARVASFKETVRALGSCAAPPGRLVQISPLLEGAVLEIAAIEGETVQAGKLLIRLDDRQAEKDLSERKAAQGALAASLALLKAPPREPERRLAELEVSRARVAADLAQAVVKRLEPLQARAEVSDQQLYEARKRLEETLLAQKAAETHLEILLLGPRAEAVAEMEAKVAGARAAVEAAEARAACFHLTAPRDGVLDRILCRTGQVLAPGTVAAIVIDLSEVYAMAGVGPAEAARLRPGQEALVSGDKGGGPEKDARRPLPGKVVSVGLEASAATGLLPLLVLVPNPEGRLRLGISVEVEVVVGTVKDALAVPEAAIVPSEKGSSVVAVRDGKAAVLSARTGLRQGGLVQVEAEGLKPGDLVVTQGGYNLPDGKPLKVEAATAPGGSPEP
jgi:multidrug efflux pump subunit AcrA (membrane-fusion protein)